MVKKRLCLSLCLALALVLCSCKAKKDVETQVTNEPTQEAKPTATQAPAATQPVSQDPVADVKEIDLGTYLADSSVWEDDGGDYSLKDGILRFNNAFYGDFCAVRLKEQVQNANVKFTLQINELATGLSVDDGTWWDSEFLCLVRSNFAGSAFVEGQEQQAGYCITSWGDMSEFSLGRSGYDDAFGTFSWAVADGKPHKVELSTVNNADNTQVTITVKVDGVEIATAVDDGSLKKKDRVSLFPDAGGVTIRCKYLDASVAGFDAELGNGKAESTASDEKAEINLKDTYATAEQWEVNGDNVVVAPEGITFNTKEAGQVAAVRYKEENKNETISFSMQFTDFAKVSMDEGNWWDSEFLCMLRSGVADKGFADGQRGYSITSWGDMSTFFLGRSGYDDAFGEFSWPMADGKEHDFKITLENNEDNTQVTITVMIDNNVVASVVDDGTLVKENRPALYPDAGGLTFRCAYLGAVIK